MQGKVEIILKQDSVNGLLPNTISVAFEDASVTLSGDHLILKVHKNPSPSSVHIVYSLKDIVKYKITII